MWNGGSRPLDDKGKLKRGHARVKSTDARDGVGEAHSSAEVPVIGMERRSFLIKLKC